MSPGPTSFSKLESKLTNLWTHPQLEDILGGKSPGNWLLYRIPLIIKIIFPNIQMPFWNLGQFCIVLKKWSAYCAWSIPLTASWVQEGMMSSSSYYWPTVKTSPYPCFIALIQNNCLPTSAILTLQKRSPYLLRSRYSPNSVWLYSLLCLFLSIGWRYIKVHYVYIVTVNFKKLSTSPPPHQVWCM